MGYGDAVLTAELTAMHEDPSEGLASAVYMYEYFVEYKPAMWADAQKTVPDDWIGLANGHM